MPENRAANRPIAAIRPGDESSQVLRQLGARAHQLRAATRAADHFNAIDNDDDRNTASWLISTAVELATDLAADIDGLAHALKENNADAGQRQTVALLRVRAHQLHAAAKAADHFLDQDTREDRDTGSWLIATALGLAERLAAEIDDSVLPNKRAAVDKQALEPHDAQLARRVAAATSPVRGAA